MDAAARQSSSAAQFGAARGDASFERRKWEGNGNQSMPFVFSMTLRAPGINDVDYLSAFHP